MATQAGLTEFTYQCTFLNMSFVLKLKIHPIKTSYPINTEDNLEYKHETCSQIFFNRETWTSACSNTILDYLCTAENFTGTCYNQWEGKITAQMDSGPSLIETSACGKLLEF